MNHRRNPFTHRIGRLFKVRWVNRRRQEACTTRSFASLNLNLVSPGIVRQIVPVVIDSQAKNSIDLALDF